MRADGKPKFEHRKIKKTGRQVLRKSLSAHPESQRQRRFFWSHEISSV